MDKPIRRAQVATGDRDLVASYLPANYRVVRVTSDGKTLIMGRDVAGWTLDGYVIPRLASGLHFAEEIVDAEALGQ